MSSNPYVEERVGGQRIEQIRRQINRLFEEVAELADQPLDPGRFYGELMQRVLAGTTAPAGAVWLRTAEGPFQLAYRVNFEQVGLDQGQAGLPSHQQLLLQIGSQGNPQIVSPHSGGEQDGSAGNPTRFVLLVAPIRIDRTVVGLLEVFQDPRHTPEAIPGFLQFLVRMAGLAGIFLRNIQLRQLADQQQIWEDLERFSRQIHASLNPTEVAYLVANEGRRLIGCDRVSVAIREAKVTRIEAISGADVVEKRSNLVQLQQTLAETVGEWGERLVYEGAKDESLPAAVLHALDAYLAESGSKLLVVAPLRDERREKDRQRPRSTLIMECFETKALPEHLYGRLEVVGRHAVSALYNAEELRRIPFRFIWQPVVRLQEGLGSRTRAILAAGGGSIVLLLLLMIVVPYPLKMDARGQLLPEERRWVYSTFEAQVVELPDYIQTGSTVKEGQDLIFMRDHKLGLKMNQLKGETAGLEAEISALRALYVTAPPAERPRILREQREKEILREQKKTEYEELVRRTGAIEDRPGDFVIRAPIGGYILNSDFRENLLYRTVKPSDPLLRIGNKDRSWEVELKIPQRHIGQIKLAFEGRPDNHELDVDLLLASAPTATYRGKLSRSKISGEAQPNRDDPNDTEPVVIARVRIDGPDIDRADQLPPELLVTGTVVHASVRCGWKPMIYSLFYGVWEFFYEKVVFWLF